MRNLETTAIVLIAFFVISVLPGVSHGDDFQLKPYLSIRGEYNDNIFFVSEDEVDDYLLVISPGIELIERTERLNVRLSAEVAPFFYKDNSDLDDVDQDYRGRIGYQFTPRFNGRADAFFIVDNRPDRDILTTGLVQGVDQRKRYHFGAGTNFLLSEKSAVDLSYDFNRDDWDRDVIPRADFTGNTVNLGFSHNLANWLEATVGRINFNYANFKYKRPGFSIQNAPSGTTTIVPNQNTEINSFAMLLGLESRLSELLNFRADIGPRYVYSDFDVDKGTVPISSDTNAVVFNEESNSGWGGVGSAILEYRGEKTLSNFLVSRELAATSGRSGPTDLFRLGFSFYYRFLRDMRFGLMTGFYRNKADEGEFSSQEIDENTFRIRPSIRWEFYDNFTLEGAYIYTYLDDKTADTDRTQNRIFFQIAYGLPLFELLDLFTPEGQQITSGAVPVPELR
jgi:hypothetical protein